MYTADVQTELVDAEQITVVMPEQPPAEQVLEQPTSEQTTIPSATVPETFSSEQQTRPATTVEDLPEIEDLPCTPPASQDEG